MAVSVLDASLSIVADTSQADAAFERLPGEAQRAFGEAEAFAQRFNLALDATAENIALAGQNLPSLGRAFGNLRISGPDKLKEGLDNALLAFEALKEGGVTAAGTLLQAQIKVTERQLAYTKAIGESTVALDAELAALQKEYALLGGSAAAKEQAAIAAKALAEAERAAAARAAEALAQQERLAAATGTISSATRAAAAEISPAWARVTQASLTYAAALKEVQAASVLFEAAAAGDVEALNLLAAAKQRAAVAAKELATAEEAVAVTTKQSALSQEAVTASFAGFSSALGALLSAGLVLHFAEGVAETVDKVDDLAHATGLTVAQIVGLQGAMKEAGDDSSRLGQQLSKLAVGLVAAETGSSQQRAVFRSLGVQFDEITGKAPDLLTALLQISDHLQRTGASGDTLGLAYKALGKNSVELVSFLQQGSAAIQEQMGHYSELGAATQRNVGSAAEFQKVQAELNAQLRAIGISTLPILTSSLKQLKETFEELKSQEIIDVFRHIDAAFIELQGTIAASGVKVRQFFNEMIRDPEVRLDAQKRAAEDLAAIWEKTGKTVREALGIEDRKVNDPFGIHQLLDDLGLAKGKLQELSDEDPAKDIAEKQKQQLEAQLANIENFKAQQHAAFAQGKIDAADWAVAQQKAADLANIAQEDYLRRLAGAYQSAGEIQKAQAAQQDLSTLKIKDAAKETEALAAAIQKHNEFAVGMLKSWADLQAQSVAKTWDDAKRAALQLADAERQLHQAQTNLLEAEISADFSARANAIEELAAVGIISEEQKAARLKQLYQEEAADQLAALQLLADQERDAINIAQANLDQGRSNPFFTDAQLENLQKNLDKALTDYTKTQEDIVATQAQVDANVTSLDARILRRATSSWDNYFSAIIRGSLSSTKAMQAGFVLTADAIGGAVNAAVAGQASFGQAMQQWAKSTLAALAAEAAVQAIYNTGWAFYYLAHQDYVGATDSFIAAGEFAAVAAAAGIAGAAIGGGRGENNGPNAPNELPPVEQTANTTANPNQPQTINVPRFATGALISQKTLAIVGDSPSGGNAREAWLPLDNPQAMEEVASEIAMRISVANTGTQYNFPNVRGVVDVKGVMKNATRAVKKGRGRLTSTESLRRR